MRLMKLSLDLDNLTLSAPKGFKPLHISPESKVFLGGNCTITGLAPDKEKDDDGNYKEWIKMEIILAAMCASFNLPIPEGFEYYVGNPDKDIYLFVKDISDQSMDKDPLRLDAYYYGKEMKKGH